MPLISGGGGGSFNGGTITGDLVISGHKLTVNQGAGQTTALNSSTGNFIQLTDSAITFRATQVVMQDDAPETVIQFSNAPGIGFFGHAPAPQPARPTDTASIIAALVALGLTS